MDTPEKQKERHYLLEKRLKLRRRLFPLRVVLIGLIFVGAIYGIKNQSILDGWLPQISIVVAVSLVLTYVIEAIGGGYKNKK